MGDLLMNVGELWRRTAGVVGDPEARWLVEVACGDAPLDEPVTERMVAHLDTMLARYRTGEPLQYVLGRWAFRRIDLAVDRRVLIPRPETELVAGVAIELAAAAGPPRQVADLGTGSGAIGLSLAAELPLDGTTVWITDASANALDVARANLAGLGRPARNVRVAAGTWFDALPDAERGRFDVIVSNPPYVAEGSPDLAASVLEWEPAAALFAGRDGLADLRALVAGAPGWLAPAGWLVLEIGADQGAAVRALLTAAGYRDVEVLPDLAGHDRIALGRRATTTAQQPKSVRRPGGRLLNDRDRTPGR